MNRWSKETSHLLYQSQSLKNERNQDRESRAQTNTSAHVVMTVVPPRNDQKARARRNRPKTNPQAKRIGNVPCAPRVFLRSSISVHLAKHLDRHIRLRSRLLLQRPKPRRTGGTSGIGTALGVRRLSLDGRINAPPVVTNRPKRKRHACNR